MGGSDPFYTVRQTQIKLYNYCLAKKADVKYTTLTKVESGVVNKPSVQTMAKIAKAIGVSIEELIK